MCDTQSANNTNDVNIIHDKNSNIDTDIPVVVKTNETKEVVIPFRSGQEAMVKQEVEDYLQRYCEIVAKEAGIDVEKVKECMPKNIVFQEVKNSKATKKNVKKQKKEKKTTINNWEEASSMDDLKDLKGEDLKDILKSKNMRSTGAKSKLIERVWSINHPEDIQVTPMKKRGRPKGAKGKGNKNSHVIVEDSDADITPQKSNDSTEDIEQLLQQSVETKMTDGKVMHVVISKKWVFSTDEDGDFDWEGYLNDDGESFTESDPPEELIKLYECED
jgi:hypothetical protein